MMDGWMKALTDASGGRCSFLVFGSLTWLVGWLMNQ